MGAAQWGSLLTTVCSANDAREAARRAVDAGAELDFAERGIAAWLKFQQHPLFATYEQAAARTQCEVHRLVNGESEHVTVERFHSKKAGLCDVSGVTCREGCVLLPQYANANVVCIDGAGTLVSVRLGFLVCDARNVDWAGFFAVFWSVIDGTNYSTTIKPDAVVKLDGSALGVGFWEYKTVSGHSGKKKDWCVRWCWCDTSTQASLATV
jgi:hypothetical protein